MLRASTLGARSFLRGNIHSPCGVYTCTVAWSETRRGP